MPRVVNPLPQLIPQRLAKVLREVEALCWERSEPLAVLGSALYPEPVALPRFRKRELVAVHPGEHFGPPRGGWQQRWFRLEIDAPGRDEHGRRHLQWDCEGETTVWIDGEPWAGLDLGHRTCPLPDEAATLWLDCSTWQTGIWLGVPGSEAIGRYGLRFDGARLRLRHRVAWNVRWDLDALAQLVRLLYRREGISAPSVVGHQPALESCSPLLRLLLRGLDDACDAFVAGGLRSLHDALQKLARRLPAEAWQPFASLCGHAHIDLVWLWPEMATERKAVHSFATQLRLLERYPEMTFVQSQPALYRAVEKRAPSLMPQIRRRIREGRWEAMGALEVEPDTNLPSGEALVRSLLCGQRKLRQLAGRPSPVCWIPDVFGYSNCLPQILHLGGVEYFYTTKMTWSAITRFPYNSFVWRGADGSEVIAHLGSTGYNGAVELQDLDGALRDHRQADVHPEMLLPTGIGDGGGGVSEMMCERARRLSNLAGAPRTRWTTAEAFFRRLAEARDRLPVYQGELYLEYHRGTLTTQSEFKRLYRAAESALQTHEAARVATGGKGLDDEAWLRVLFCQFHDALPGSSIGRVYHELEAELELIIGRELEAARREIGAPAAVNRVRRRSPSGNKSEAPLTLFNPLPQERTVVVELAQRPPGGLIQKVGEGKRRAWLAAARLGALECGPPSDALDVPAAQATRSGLDNGIVRAELSRGQLAAVSVDGRPLELAAPAGLVLYHDLPANFDAWDIDHYTLRRGDPVPLPSSLEVVEAGPLRARLRSEASLGERSRAQIDYVLEAGSRYLRIEVQVDWRESHRLLKFHLPTRYLGRWARYGCPFGSIQRPQAPGTAADEAMWEVAGSRWAAVTRDDGAGLAVCAEAKYGFSCRDGDLGLSLLRSSKEPDPTADLRRHSIRFAIGAYEPSWKPTAASTAAAADALFAPVVVASGGVAPPLFAFEGLGGLVPSWVAPAATRDGYLVRLHETAGGAGTAGLALRRPPRAVELVDLLENRLASAVRTTAGRYEIPYGPYQIVSLRVTPT